MTSQLRLASHDEPPPGRRFALRTAADGHRMMLARRGFQEGAVLAVFQGQVHAVRPAGAVLWLGAGRWLLLDPIAAAVGRACRPNAVLVEDAQGPLLRALRSIRYGEAITYDHATWLAPEDPTAARACLCAATGCRGVVGSFAMLPSATTAAYLDRGGVPAHVRDALR